LKPNSCSENCKNVKSKVPNVDCSEIKFNKKNIEPTKVYKKNKYAAFILSKRVPQIPIIKNIGIKILSKAIKKINKLVVVNATNKKNSIKKKQIIKYLKYATISQETNKHIGVIKVVNKIKNKEIPSISKNQEVLKKLSFDSTKLVN
jgi:hypothetical protein